MTLFSFKFKILCKILYSLTYHFFGGCFVLSLILVTFRILSHQHMLKKSIFCTSSNTFLSLPSLGRPVDFGFWPTTSPFVIIYWEISQGKIIAT